MRRNEKWPGTVFHRLLDGSIFPDPAQIVPFPSTFRQKHFSDRRKHFLLQTFGPEYFSWSNRNSSFSIDLSTETFFWPQKTFTFTDFWTGVFFLVPQKHFPFHRHLRWFFFSIHLVSIMQILIAVSGWPDLTIFIHTHHCKTIYLVCPLLWVQCCQSCLVQEETHPFNILSKWEWINKSQEFFLQNPNLHNFTLLSAEFK